jgi:HK97 family phage major capsid protein
MTELDPNRVGTPLTIYGHVTDWMPIKPINKKYMSILVVYSYEDGAGTKTEGSASSQSSFLLKTVEFVAATIATYFTLSDESLDDLPEAMEEISIIGPDKIKDNIDSQILGSAGNDTSTIKGLYAASKHTDFTGSTTYAASIASPSIVDVIACAKHQGESNKYLMDTVVMNSLDILKLAAAKDQLDNSKTDRRVAFNNLGEPVAVCGLVIRKNTSQTVNTLTVLANNTLQIGDRKQMAMEIGYNGTDFTEGQKTVRIGVRLAFAVRDAAAVIYCDDIATAISNIATV